MPFLIPFPMDKRIRLPENYLLQVAFIRYELEKEIFEEFWYPIYQLQQKSDASSSTRTLIATG